MKSMRGLLFASAVGNIILILYIFLLQGQSQHWRSRLGEAELLLHLVATAVEGGGTLPTHEGALQSAAFDPSTNTYYFDYHPQHPPPSRSSEYGLFIQVRENGALKSVGWHKP